MTGFILPAEQAPASGWALSDWLEEERTSAPADATGTITIDFGQLDPVVMWLVDRIVVHCTSSTTTALKIYDSAVTPARLRDRTSQGNDNAGDYPNGLLFRPSRSMVLQWTGATAGAVATAAAQIRQMRHS